MNQLGTVKFSGKSGARYAFARLGLGGEDFVGPESLTAQWGFCD